MVKENTYPVVREVSHVVRKAPTVNYHLLRACNYSCGFCFAPFLDILGKRELSREKSIELVDALCQAGFSKLNLAGGEPTLRPWLPELIWQAKTHRVTTSIVTNGSRITPNWLDDLGDSLDIIALSIDSVTPETQQQIGRVEKGNYKTPITAEQFLELSEMIRGRGIRLKVNTVVNRFNHAEDLRSFILAMQPERWKIFQTLPVVGQNDSRISEFAISESQFAQYVERNRSVERREIRVVPESNDLMTGSYVMVDPLGRFFDNTKGHHTYSRPILDIGVIAALEDVTVDTDRFHLRGGSYQ